MKKIISLLLCLMLILSLAVPAFADGNEVPVDNEELTSTIIIEDGAPGATYYAYKLFYATHDDKGTEDETDDIYGYHLNPKYLAVLQAVSKKEGDADIRKYLEEQDSEDEAEALAEAIYKQIVTNNLVESKDQSTTNDKFEDIPQGYYLIIEKALGHNKDEDGNELKNDTYSLYMLDTLGENEITIVTKESYPTVTKQVLEVNDSKAEKDAWQDYASFDVGDVIEFKITGTVSGRYDSYKNYYYCFEDKMDEGLTLVEDSIEIKLGGTIDIKDPHFTIDTTPHSFTAKANLKTIEAVTLNSSIVVTYKAILNEKANHGTTGNENEVVLKFQNDPHWTGTGEPNTPGETPKDINVIFTFDALVNKVDENGSPLSGAGFTLQKFDKVTQTYKSIPVSDNNTPDDPSDDIYELTGTDMTAFNFTGLDEGVYKLVESKTPSGYNPMVPLIFHIHAVYDTTEDPAELVTLEVTDKDGYVISTQTTTQSGGSGASKAAASFNVSLTAEKSQISTVVENHPGGELPSTGGTGTTLIYIAGGILVLAAIVLLVTKKRMSSAE